MKKLMFVPATVVALVFAFNAVTASADEKKEGADGTSKIEKLLNDAMESGSGLTQPQFDKKGNMVSCIVIGSSSIPRSMSQGKALQFADKRAVNDVHRQFVTFVKTKTKVYQTEQNETIVCEEGSARDKEMSNSETSKDVSKNADKLESVSEGIVQGMERLAKKVDSEKRIYYVAYGWSKENAKAAAKLEKGESPESRKSAGTARSEAGEEGSQTKETPLKDDFKVSPGADKFLKKDQ